jgi:hypothetical protein
VGELERKKAAGPGKEQAGRQNAEHEGVQNEARLHH